MKNKILIALLFFACVMISSECESEPDITTGHLKILVNYSIHVIENGRITGTVFIPEVGADVRLYNKDARCRDYQDACNLVAFIGEKSYRSSYFDVTDKNGELVISNILVGRYYLVVKSEGNRRYSEKVIEISENDTLELIKYFSNSVRDAEKLEQWN